MIGGIVVGFGGYLLYNTVNKAGANSSRVVTEPLLAEAMAARRRDKVLALRFRGLSLYLSLIEPISSSIALPALVASQP